MNTLFWGCLAGGTIFALFTLLGGHLFHRLHGLHHFIRFHGIKVLHPATLVGAITAFGGAGIMLMRYTALTDEPLLITAGVIALLASVGVHFGYVRPMSRSESSIGYSIREYAGRTGTVTVKVPARGLGQVMVRMGAANTCQVAASFEEIEIPRAAHIVVVEVRDGILYVSPIDIH